MGLWSWLTGAGAAKEVVGGAGKAISNLLDRRWPKKMSEIERFQTVKDIAQIDLSRSDIEVKDVNKAREMWMTFLRTQKIPWAARFLNAIYRPIAGFMALLYLTDKFWAQMVRAFYSGFQWKAIERDPITDAAMTTIILFFFGFRHAAKKKGLTGTG